MADVTIGARLTVDTSSATTNVKNFKQELQLATQQVTELSAKFGATSKEATEAAKRAAELKNAIGDAKSLVDAFNPDTKFRAFGASINTVVGGFTALQGVMGLVGVESQEVQKALLKVQSALAISQGIAQLQEGIKSFKNLGAVIQATTLFQKANTVATNLAAGAMRLFGIQTTATSTAMGVLKGAIIATGIGALVVVLALAADAMGLFSDKTDEAAEAQERLEAQIKLTSAALEGETKALAREEKLELARAKLAGASEEVIFQIKQKYRRLNFDATTRAYNELADKETEQGQKLLQQLKDFNTEGQVAQLEFDAADIERQKAKNEKLAQLAREARQKLLKEAIDEQNRQSSNFTALGGPSGGLNIEIPKSPEQIAIENTVAAAHKALEEKEKIFLTESDMRSKAFTDIKDKTNEAIALEQYQYETRKLLLTSTADLFSSLSALIGKETAAGKVLAIAQATINTFVGATEVLRAKSVLPEPAGTISKIINVAAVIATGLAAVKNIVKTNVPGAAGGAVPTVSAPITPKATTTTTSLDQQSLNAIGNATTRAYVLETDVSSNQERITRLNRAARLG